MSSLDGLNTISTVAGTSSASHSERSFWIFPNPHTRSLPVWINKMLRHKTGWQGDTRKIVADYRWLSTKRNSRWPDSLVIGPTRFFSTNLQWTGHCRYLDVYQLLFFSIATVFRYTWRSYPVICCLLWNYFENDFSPPPTFSCLLRLQRRDSHFPLILYLVQRSTVTRVF